MATFQRFDDISRRSYKVIYADPPWLFKVRSPAGEGRSPSQHYSCMTIADLKKLPVSQLAAPGGAILFMWVTDPHLQIGLEVMNAWGFTYKTVGFTWAKLKKSWTPTFSAPGTGAGLFSADDFFTGMGYYTRANPEMCLIGTSVARIPPRLSKAVRQLLIAKVREHSRKPDEAYDRIESLFGGPYIELFGRNTRPGWDTWGNEPAKFD